MVLTALGATIFAIPTIKKMTGWAYLGQWFNLLPIS